MAKKKKKIVRIAKLQFLAGKAKPGPELAGLGINMPEFSKDFNDKTRDRGSEPVPVEITIYSDKSFSFVLKTAPASYKLKEAAKIESGAANSKTDIAGTVNLEQLKEIAKYKMVDMNTDNLDSAMQQVLGTAKNMGIKVEGIDDLKAAEQAAKQAQKERIAAESKLKQLDADSKANIDSKDQAIEIHTVKETDEGSEDEKKEDDQ